MKQWTIRSEDLNYNKKDNVHRLFREEVPFRGNGRLYYL